MMKPRQLKEKKKKKKTWIDKMATAAALVLDQYWQKHRCVKKKQL